MSTKVVITGVGSMDRSVVPELLAHGRGITLIDNMPRKLCVSSMVDTDQMSAGACSPGALCDADVAEVGVMVAATGDSKANLVTSLLVETEFAVPRVVVCLNSPKNEWLFDQAWDMDVSVSAPCTMTPLVEEAVSVGVPVRLFSSNTVAVSMHTLILPEDSPIVGKRVHSLQLPTHSVLVALLRDGHPITSSTGDVFEISDKLLLFVPDTDTAELEGLRQPATSPISEEFEDENTKG